MKKIIFMGTPDFAVPALERLSRYEGCRIIAVVTQPDKSRDRGRKVRYPAVKETAVKLDIPVIQPEKIRDNEVFLAEIENLSPDLIVVAAYGKILPEKLLAIPKYGCINIHGSLLPKYRGAAPIHRAVIDGEKETGITIMDMVAELDAGDMIAKAATPIGRKTSAELHMELAELGAELLISILPDIFSGKAVRIPQDDKKATYASMVFKEDGRLDFTKRPEELERLVRGMNSWPGASAIYGDLPMKIWECRVKEGVETVFGKPGEIVGISEEGLELRAGDGILVLTKIQMPNKKAMAVSEFLKGNKIKQGEILS